MRRLAFAGALLAAACQPAATDTPSVDSPVVPPPPPFAAVSDTARAVTGGVSLSAEPRANPDDAPGMKLAGVNGLTYVTELLPDAADAAVAIDWKILFGHEVVTAANPPPRAPSVQVHTIVREDVPANASNGGFCGERPTTYIAMATGLEEASRKLMMIAAFSSPVWPPQTPDVLCGVYTYSPPEAAL